MMIDVNEVSGYHPTIKGDEIHYFPSGEWGPEYIMTGCESEMDFEEGIMRSRIKVGGKVICRFPWYKRIIWPIMRHL